MFPLYLLHDDDAQGSLALRSEPEPKFTPAFLKAFCTVLNVSPKGARGLPAGLMPEDIFHYTYAVFHSPTYRTRYAEFLKIDFPRLPLTSSLDLFRALAKLGGELVALHLMESPKLDKHITKWVGGKNQKVEKMSFSTGGPSAPWAGNAAATERDGHLGAVFIDKAQTEGFRGVPKEVVSCL